MMFKKWKGAFFLLLSGVFFSFMLLGTKVEAADEKELPVGDILIMYSEGISNEDMTNVMNLVEELTYQSMQVTFAPASECLGHLQEYSAILCYKIERFPQGLIEEIYEREKKGNQILQAREGIKNSSGEGDIRIMFVGNRFLRSYLKETGRESTYIDVSMQVGKLQYAFTDNVQKESLVKESDFLFLTGELDYKTGNLNADKIAGYACARRKALYHIPISDLTDNLIRAVVSREVSLWKWPYDGEPHVYAQYMVLNKVYPFQNPDKLLEVVNYMIDREEPFAISVMPVYNNGNYPAMQHFCEVLRYAQANGGVILIHSPINQMPDFDAFLVNEYLTAAISIYMEQGVYPMGIQVPVNWLFNKDTIEVISRFRTVMVSDEEDSLIKQDEDVNTNLIYKDGHQWIAPAIALDAEGTSYLKTYSTSVSFDISDPVSAIERKVKACMSSEVPLKSLWDIEHSFWTDEDIMDYRNHIIMVNGKQIEKSFETTDYDKKFEYNRNMLQRFSKDLSKENSKLIIAVVAVAALFLFFILLARYRNKQRFFKKESRQERKMQSEDDMTEESLERLLLEKQKETILNKDLQQFDIDTLDGTGEFAIKDLKKNDDFDY